MIIQKNYRFYAAHRNQEFQDRCRNLHGHRYEITCYFEVERTGSLTTLFADFDSKMEAFLNSEYDQGMLIHYDEALVGHMQRTGESLKFKRLSRPTTVQNMAHQLFREITEMGFRLSRIEIRETDTSVSYTRRDWVNDNRYFCRQSLLTIPLS